MKIVRESLYEDFKVLKGPTKETFKKHVLNDYKETVKYVEDLYSKYGSWTELPPKEKIDAKRRIRELYSRAGKYNTGPEKNFKVGEKQMHVLNFIRQNNGARYTDIVKFVYELSYGKDMYTYEERGYWSGAFIDRSWFKAWIPRMTYKDGNLYKLNFIGLERLEYLANKFDYDITQDEENQILDIEPLEKFKEFFEELLF